MNTNPLINHFWRRWLSWTTIGLIGFGLAFMLIPHGMQSFYDLVFFGDFFPVMAGANQTFSPEAIRYIAFVYGVLGAVLVGWAILLLMIIHAWLPENEKRAWQAVALSVGIWFPLDSGFSMIMGFHMNAVMNVGFLVLYAIPLAATYGRVFARKNAAIGAATGAPG